MDMIRCPRCAREIPDFSRFCRRCGCAIVWRGQIGAATVPPLPATINRTITLGSPRQTSGVTSPPAIPVKPSVRTAGSGGAGIFAILAAAGLVCFVNYHAVMRPMSAPAQRSVRYESEPMFPSMTPEAEEVATPYVVPLPAPRSYPVPLRSNVSPSSSRRYAPTPQAPPVPMPRTPGAPRSYERDR
jgi:hypothetical protein